MSRPKSAGHFCSSETSADLVPLAFRCEDAFSIKEQSEGETSTVTGGGAVGAANKVFQHDAGGTLKVSGFTVSDSAKLYASCGANCPTSKRIFEASDITASNVEELVGKSFKPDISHKPGNETDQSSTAIQPANGDTATLSGINASDVGKLCTEYAGNSPSGKNTGACKGEGASGGSSSGGDDDGDDGDDDDRRKARSLRRRKARAGF